MIAPLPLSIATVVAILLGGGLLVLTTTLAVRARGGPSGLAWIIVAGVAYGVLAMAAALHLRESDGVRAAAIHLIAVLLAALLGAATSWGASADRPPPSRLTCAAWGVAWLTLVGLPPTLAFHGKLMVYRALLLAGWDGLVVLAMAASAAALAPALWAMRAPPRMPLRGLRAGIVVVLLAAIVLLGIYPQPALTLAGVVSGAPGPG